MTSIHKYFVVFIAILATLNACKLNSTRTTNSYEIEDSDSIKISPELSGSIERGGLIYTDFCTQCHMANGKGIPGTFPPLAASNWLNEKRTEIIHAVKYGQSGEIVINREVYDGVMVPMGLGDEEIADVLNYIMNSWGNSQEKMVTASEVGEIQK